MADPFDPTPDEVLESFYGSSNPADWTAPDETTPPAPNPAQWDSFVEGDIEMPADPVSAPSAPLPGTSAGASRSVSSGSSSGSSTSRSYTGVPQEKQDSLLTRYESQNAASEQEFDQNAAAERAAVESRRTGETQLIKDQARIEREHQTKLQQLADEERDFNETAAELERGIRDQEIVDREAIMGEYKQQLAGVRSLAAQSGNPLGGLSQGEALGLGAAGFAQGFLAAQGIQINVTGQIDKWVDREIAVHQQKIENAKDGAAATMHLYNVARQSSEDDWEARERYRGFVMEHMKSQIQVEAARFGTQLATQKAAERVAELDAQLNASIAGIGSRKSAKIAEARKANLEEYKAIGLHARETRQQADSHRVAQQNANAASMNARTNRMAEERAEKERKEKVVDDDGASVSFGDPGATVRDPKTGKVTGITNRWRYARDPKTGKVIATKHQKEQIDKTVNEKTAAYALIKGGIERLRAIKAPAEDGFIEKYGPLMGKKLFSEEKRKYERERFHTIREVRRLTAGANLVGHEKGEWDGILANDSGWEDGSNDSALSQFEKSYRANMVASLDNMAGAEAIPVKERTERPYAGDDSNDTDVAYNLDMNAKNGPPGPVGDAARTIVSDDASRNEVKLGGGYSPAYFEFMKRTGDTRGAGTTSNREHTPGQRQEIDAVDRLAALVLEGVHPEEALGTIKRLANNESPDGSDKTADPEVREYAREVYRDLSDPWNDTKSQKGREALLDRYTRRAHEADEQPTPLSPYGETDVASPSPWENQ
jgi:hypothetical protein